MRSNHTAAEERIFVLVRYKDGQTYEEILYIGRVADVRLQAFFVAFYFMSVQLYHIKD
jgi:hypothetical protein